MDPHLLALASSGSSEELKSLLEVCASSSKKPQTLFNEEEGTAAEGDTAALVSSEKLQTLINMEKGGQACGNNGRDDGSLHMQRACDNDIEANELILEGDTALHVVAASGQGDNFFTRFREAKHLLLVEQNKKKQRPIRTELHALTTYGDSDNFLESARIIYGKAKHLLFGEIQYGQMPHSSRSR
jgi:hypothetical protein